MVARVPVGAPLPVGTRDQMLVAPRRLIKSLFWFGTSRLETGCSGVGKKLAAAIPVFNTAAPRRTHTTHSYSCTAHNIHIQDDTMHIYTTYMCTHHIQHTYTRHIQHDTHRTCTAHTTQHTRIYSTYNTTLIHNTMPYLQHTYTIHYTKQYSNTQLLWYQEQRHKKTNQ